MMAGAALSDWRHASRTSAVALVTAGRVAAAFVYAKPYGLEGVDAGAGGVTLRSHNLAIGLGLSHVGFGRYHEFDPSVGAAVLLPCSAAAGLGVHGLVVSDAVTGVRFAPAFDVALGWFRGTLGLAAGLRRVNQPRFENGDELAAQFFGGIVWRPAIHLVALATDFERTRDYESIRLGMEVEPIAGLRLRCGLCSEPLSYAGGAALSVGQLVFDYAFRFHPCLGGTHLVGTSWCLR